MFDRAETGDATLVAACLDATMPVLPLRTDRLLLRVMRPADAPVLAAYRNDPEIARYQAWDLPYTLAHAERLLSGQSELEDLAADDWVQIAIEVRDGPDGHPTVVGDAAVGLSAEGVATLGYTLAPAWHGRGYASEAAAALVDTIFERTAVHRIEATLDPANQASMRVIEPLGFRYEGTARESEHVRGEWLDDMRFALLRADRAAWLARPRHRPDQVELMEVTPGLLTAVLALETHRFQRSFVSPVERSLAQALVPPRRDGRPLVPWHRAIVADGEVAGHVMLAEASPSVPRPYLWRLLIDRRHQGRGIGAVAVGMIIERLRADGNTALDVSWVDEPGGPRRFYERLGFEPTGVVSADDEVEGRLVL